VYLSNSRKDSTPYLSIFIPTYNDETDLSACLKSIRRINYPREKVEIVIWDNASQDNTVQMVKQYFDKMQHEKWLNLYLAEWDKNEGSYIPYNLILSKLSQKTMYILGLDADIEFEPNALQAMVDAAQGDNIAVVGARSVYFDRPEVTSHGAGFVHNWLARYTEKDVHERIDCDYVIGCCWLLDKTIFQRLGSFDPDYYINHWEIDYCLRAKKKGFRIVYEPRAVCKHKIPLKGSLSKERIYYLYRNKILVIKKNAPFPQKWISLGLYSLLFFPKAILDSIFRNQQLDNDEIRVILRAMIDGLLNRVGKKELII
jgi:GT2 family glycosyltransferase